MASCMTILSYPLAAAFHSHSPLRKRSNSTCELNTDVGRQQYEPVDSGTELGHIGSEIDYRGRRSDDDFDTTALRNAGVENVKRPHNIFRSPKIRLPVRLEEQLGPKTRRFKLFAGLFASLAVFICNVAFLVYGVLKTGTVHGGIAMLMRGDLDTVSRISTTLHILTNALSTILLTSSNYAMQLLCAPTLDEINYAHKNGLGLRLASWFIAI
ncbi:hypothetical protein BU25DRAFT_8561 [Macroventuria anomochaeta]|uniref:Uncharacterized protein n=1 Tax=Macroventuria anomochaeta TaxID=301207 RepID=A0ACB6SJU9_9PLEO|nr:uncharacterized protein BU25DRAFT_8561 [Macroventuria anomochaeta]KAF2633562.1 hypothetical protein BU25DRAFT_8561 [Macroventuria anomochaeta]